MTTPAQCTHTRTTASGSLFICDRKHHPSEPDAHYLRRPRTFPVRRKRHLFLYVFAA